VFTRPAGPAASRYARCYDYVSKPGDLLYYPPNYWHQTMNLDDETVCLTSRYVLCS
jgi:ribosomal protein L16 Arg81 hydroxylase